MNIRWVLKQYKKDHVRSRVYAHLATLFILGSLIIMITHNVVDRVLESEEELRDMNSEKLRKATIRE